jgi:predicted dehydrogenase
MTHRPGWGILATGWIAEQFTKDLKSAGLNVTAVGSRSATKADAFARRFAIPSHYGSYEELVADRNVDIVYIATPHPQHVSAALLAIEAGKHVLIEKPFALNAREARRIIAHAEAKNVCALEAMWTRFLPHMKRIREIISEGTIGNLRSISADHLQRLPTDPAHRLNSLALGGGALLDLGVYPLSFCFDIMGAPTTMSATARFKPTGVDAEVAIIMTHAGGAISSTVSALDLAHPNEARIFGSKARIEIDATWYAPTSFRVVDYDGMVIEQFNERVAGRGMQFQAFEMEDMIEKRRHSDLMPQDHTIAIMGLLDEARRQIGLTYPQEEQQQ